MVATIAALKSAAQAGSYYAADDSYYAESGKAQSLWAGRAAAALGLAGPVDLAQFQSLLEGRLPNGQTLGTKRSDTLEHRPGWDITLSAPKSVSIMALVAGDERLIAAHERAVAVALDFVERHGAATRIRGEDGVERVQTGELMVATFRHETSRAVDPQLHTHSVVMNATRDGEGNWRSLEPRALYILQKSVGAICRQELATEAERLGYQIEQGRDSLFELKDVPEPLLKVFSERAAQVEERLAERGKTRETASAAEKQIAALDTRAGKSVNDGIDLINEWRSIADKSGLDQTARLDMVRRAETRAAMASGDLAKIGEAEATARFAAKFAQEKLSERQSVFSAADLEMEAGQFALGRSSHDQIMTAIGKAHSAGQLLERTYIDPRGLESQGFTTSGNVDVERRMLEAEDAGRQALLPVLSVIDAARIVAHAALAAEHQGHPWNDDQRTALRGLLNSPNRVVAIQGYAGTAKTSTVLANYTKAAGIVGFDIVPLAPTASAARTLGEALDRPGLTVAKHLTRAERDATSPDGREAASKQIWLVDEASLLSARDMAQLLGTAEKIGSRVVLVGDVKQLGSVEAGNAFGQLQEAGMETHRLTEIVRQTNDLTKQAVYAAIEGDARKALIALESGGGQVQQQESPEERFAAMARDYAALTEAERKQTIVIEPSVAGREALTAEIRRAMAEAGQLTGPAVSVRTLESRGLTKAETKDARSFAVGDVVMFGKDYASQGVTKSTGYEIDEIRVAQGRVSLVAPDGKRIDWTPRQWGAARVDVFRPAEREIRNGDRIEFTRNDHKAGRENGTRAQVLSVDPARNTARIRDEQNRVSTLRLDQIADQHIRHGYVQTNFAAQGRTADRVLAHVESFRTNLVDQKSFYVSISRARQEARLYTDDREKLIAGIRERSGMVQEAGAETGARAQRPGLSLMT